MPAPLCQPVWRRTGEGLHCDSHDLSASTNPLFGLMQARLPLTKEKAES